MLKSNYGIIINHTSQTNCNNENINTCHIREAIIKKNGESWEFVPTGGREVYPDPNLLTGFLKCSECPETYNKHKLLFFNFKGG